MIKIQDLTFSYGKDGNVLNDLTLNVPPGSIYGFIGSNGAGKSTTIRCILGLLIPQKGSITILGKSITTDPDAILEDIGFLIEGPKFYSNLTCYENLELLKCYFKIGDANIEDVLVLVGMWDLKDKLFRNCSTGMKQRLGLARSFLHNPKLIILDEPLNGLDPEWIAETREMIINFNKTFGTTIFLSSHLLSELEKVATHIGILRNGSMEYEGKIQDILNPKYKTLQVEVEVTSAIDLLWFPTEVNAKLYGANTYEFSSPINTSINTVIQIILNRNITIKDIRTSKLGLEDIYIKN